jgi:hypothetical protein
MYQREPDRDSACRQFFPVCIAARWLISAMAAPGLSGRTFRGATVLPRYVFHRRSKEQVMSNPANRSDPAPAQAITGRLRPGITLPAGGPPYRFARNSSLKNAKVMRAARGKNGQVIKAAVVGAIGTAINQRMLVATPSANRPGRP